MNVQRITGKVPKELEELLELPPEFTYIWQDFLLLNSTRPAGFGVSPITYTEIKSYADLHGYEYDPWEVQLIKLFDNTALKHYSEQQKKESSKAK